MSVSKLRQAGSATTFVIVAVILVAATIGSIYFVVKRGEQAREDQATSRLAAQEAAQKVVDEQNAKQAEANKSTSTSSPSTTTVATNQSTNTSELPTTGIEFDIVRVLALGVLTGTITSFVVSRRSLKRSL